MKFLRRWAADWRGAEMKCVLSQTLFASLQTHANTRDERNYADLDSGGWPHSARDAALKEIRKSFAVHITGDQHLASVVHYGVEDFDNAGYAFCTPAVTNLWRRWWEPDEPGGNRRPGSSRHTGEYVDGFGNLMTVMAVANPPAETTEDKLTSRATGWGVIVFDKQKRTITFNCWPRRGDITSPKSKQYPGWPVTCRQQDNYGRKAAAYLPTIRVRGMDDPVVQVIEEKSGEIVYTLRIKGTEFRPKVFEDGTYTIIVGDQGRRQETLTKVRALPPDVRRVIDIEL
jgi:hypothetical protein